MPSKIPQSLCGIIIYLFTPYGSTVSVFNGVIMNRPTAIQKLPRAYNWLNNLQTPWDVRVKRGFRESEGEIFYSLIAFFSDGCQNQTARSRKAEITIL